MSEDPLGPAKGLMLGVALAVVFWAAVIVAVVLL